MKIVKDKITLAKLKEMSGRMFSGLVKAVVDIEKGTMAVDASMHADEEQYLIDNGSKQDDLWGINLYPELDAEEFIEFDSMINLKPDQKNFSRSVENAGIQKKIITIVNKLIDR